MGWIGVAGGVLEGISVIVYVVAFGSAANDFVSHGSQTYPEANALLGRGSLLIPQIGNYLGLFLLAMALVMVSLNAMRVGLLTRFLGYLGIIGGVLTIIPLVPIPIVEAYWLLALAYLLSGRWPSGVPPAWSSGRAEPWPSASSSAPPEASRPRGAGGARGARGAKPAPTPAPERRGCAGAGAPRARRRPSASASGASSRGFSAARPSVRSANDARAGCRCSDSCPGSCPRRGPGQVRFARCLEGRYTQRRDRSWATRLGRRSGAGLCGLESVTVERPNAVRRSPFIVRSPPLDAADRPLTDPPLEAHVATGCNLRADCQPLIRRIRWKPQTSGRVKPTSHRPPSPWADAWPAGRRPIRVRSGLAAFAGTTFMLSMINAGLVGTQQGARRRSAADGGGPGARLRRSRPADRRALGVPHRQHVRRRGVLLLRGVLDLVLLHRPVGRARTRRPRSSADSGCTCGCGASSPPTCSSRRCGRPARLRWCSCC